MLNALIDLIHRLRDAAIPISMVEAVDATEALRHVDLGSRAELRAALKTVLVKRAEHAASFAALFDVYFAARRADAPRSGGGPPDVADPTAADDLLQALHDALRRNDEGALRAMATRAEAGRPHRAPAPLTPARAARCAPNDPPLAVRRGRAARARLSIPEGVQGGSVPALRCLRVGRGVRALHPVAPVRDERGVLE